MLSSPFARVTCQADASPANVSIGSAIALDFGSVSGHASPMDVGIRMRLGVTSDLRFLSDVVDAAPIHRPKVIEEVTLDDDDEDNELVQAAIRASLEENS